MMKDDALTFAENGTYFVIIYGQTGSEDRKGVGEVHLWFRLNSENMASSNAVQSVSLICRMVLPVRAGDKLQLAFSTDATNDRLEFVASEPGMDSMFLTMFKSSA